MLLPKRMVLVRHGESEGNAVKADDNSFPDKPNHDFALTPLGRQQALETGTYLYDNFPEFDLGFVSTFRRTQETMAVMRPDIPLLQVDSRLNELWRGIWHTMPKADVARLYPEESGIKKRERWYHYRPPGGQSCQDVDLMIYSFLQGLPRYAGKSLLIAAHGNWMILLWRILNGRSTADAEHRYHHDKYHNGSITVYEGGQDGNWIQVLDNFVP